MREENIELGLLPRGMPERGSGLTERRDRKNDVDMMSNCQPCLRATASAFGTFGRSMSRNAAPVA